MTEPPQRVLILRFGAAGDVLLTTPAVHTLAEAWPDTEILWATKRAFVPLIAHNPHVDEVVALDDGESLGAFIERLRARQVEVVIDLHDKMRSRAVRQALKARTYVWEKRDPKWSGLNQLAVRLSLRTYEAGTAIATRMHHTIERAVGRDLAPGDLRVFVGEDDQARADALLAEHGLNQTEPFVGMSVGANWETKRWPIEYFAELAARAREAGTRILLTGSESERPLAQRVCARVSDTVDLVGQTDLGVLAGVIGRCRAFVANDSAPLHVARGLGVPTLMIFGSTDPHIIEPEGHEVLHAQLPCSPCHFYGRNFCPRFHFRCMRDLRPADAWPRLQHLLEVPRRPFNHA